MRSITSSASASSAVYALASSTVASIASALRPRSAAMLRTSAVVSSSTFLRSVGGKSWPVPEIGAAAPMFVPGAIAATFAATVTSVPADAACAPRGDTNTTVGMFALSSCSTRLRIVEPNPPGVSSRSTSAVASRDSASSSNRSTYRSSFGSSASSILPSSTTSSGPPCAGWGPSQPTNAPTTATTITNSPTPRQTRRPIRCIGASLPALARFGAYRVVQFGERLLHRVGSSGAGHEDAGDVDRGPAEAVFLRARGGRGDLSRL